MAITFFGAASNPTDGGTLFGSGTPVAVTPPASMVTGDLVYFVGLSRKNSSSLAMSETSGQTWTSETLYQGGASCSIRAFWCRYNGTWGANPSLADTSGDTSTPVMAVMSVYRPTNGSNTWAVDVSQTVNNVTAPLSPFDVTAPSRTAVATSTVSLFTFFSNDNNSWTIQTAGFSNPGNAQYRNIAVSPIVGKDLSISQAYKILTSATTTGAVTNRQTALGGDNGGYVAITFKEQSAAVTVASAGDALFYDTETSIVIAGTGFGAVKGAGAVIISATDNIAAGTAVTQTTTAWGDTSVTFTGSLSTFTPFSTLYLFVKNNGGTANSNGFPIKRESRMSVSTAVGNLAGSATTSLSNIRYRISDETINGTLLLSGLTEVTDGSGVIDIGPYTLTEGGDLSPGDDIWITLAIEGANQAGSKATCAKITPTYS